ncbi:DUF2358 domain-containing protein [Geminocystis sp. GBBB08]|uniref:DUF2358 domain-containing protein n=1 Tax=Geminocystis sp. GBBB08 TaxID=2604140 RepID=UPI0027E28897|nr:DUF2358 domain-containing protein [Geminocystis sp. GBBB08]MBL1209425.1 DUF2358 domain-containing protein [Geminocystis sp. GBBB08]
MNLTEIIKQDYQQFPENQTYSIYDENVHFKDPIYNFYGLKKYQKMIAFLKKWFNNLHLELHEIKHNNNQIDTRWTMSWNSPLPWQPFICVSGRSELKLKDNLIIGHYDYWDGTFWDMIKQHFIIKKS